LPGSPSLRPSLNPGQASPLQHQPPRAPPPPSAGVGAVIADALAAGAAVGLLAETHSTAADDVVGCALLQLGPQLAGQVKVGAARARAATRRRWLGGAGAAGWEGLRQMRAVAALASSSLGRCALLCHTSCRRGAVCCAVLMCRADAAAARGLAPVCLQVFQTGLHQQREQAQEQQEGPGEGGAMDFGASLQAAQAKVGAAAHGWPACPTPQPPGLRASLARCCRASCSLCG
jgi:hypothetical protein